MKRLRHPASVVAPWHSTVLLLLAGLLVAATTSATFASFFMTTSNSGNSYVAGTVTLTDNDGGAAMLSLSSALSGATDTSCIRTSYTGSLGASVRHYATVTGPLAPYLSLMVTRGGGSTGFDNCAGFTADATNYIGAGPGVVYDGTLADYPGTYGSGVVDRSTSAGTSDYLETVLATPGLMNYWRLDPGLISVDAFDDSPGRPLQQHTGGVGATWTKRIGTDLVFTNANRVRKPVSTPAVYYSSGVPPSADYSVEADLHVFSVVGGEYVGLVGRLDPSNANGTFYTTRYGGTEQTWHLYRFVNGTSTLLASYPQALTLGQTYHVKLDMNGSTIRVLIDGVQRISVTNATITAAGRAGVRMLGPALSNTTGIHIDNFRASYPTPTASDSHGTNHGTYQNGVLVGVAGALNGDTSTAAQFDGVDDYVNVARQMQADGSIELWFKSTQGLNTSDQWRGNAGLFDADGSTGSNDFGVSLRSDGKITGGTDAGGGTSIVSAVGGYNDGAWHHVILTRNSSTGEIKLYVDGQLSGSATGGTGSVAEMANVDFGRQPGATNHYAGALDDVGLYSAVLGAAEVWSHYAARFSPESWTTSETHDYMFQITLDEDGAAEALSSTATFIWEARNR